MAERLRKTERSEKEREEKSWYRMKLQEILQRKEKWIRVEDFDMSPGCPPGENFVGDVVRVVVYGSRLCGDAWADFRISFIVKRVPEPTSPSHVFHDCERMFRNEIAAYKDVLPSLQRYLTTKSWSGSAQLCFPKFYGHCRRFLVLQDLQTEGYQVVNRIKGFNPKECLAIVKELSKFHALSFALKKDYGVLFLQNVRKLKETVFFKKQKKKITGTLWENSIKLAMRSLNESKNPRLRKASKKLSFYSGRVLSTLADVVKPDHGKFDVVCHGDLWNNNILLKYCESGYPVGVKFIDLQAMRYSSCVLDVMHVLFTSSRPVIYRKHLEFLLFEYYYSLDRNLDNLGAVPDFTFGEFMYEFQRKISFGVFVSCLMFTCVTRTSMGEPSLAVEPESQAEPEFDKMYAALSPGYHERLRALFLALDYYSLI